MPIDDAGLLIGFDEHTQTTYQRSQCATFRTTNERWGGLSNMAAGYPIVVNGIAIHTIEALYQACRFPHRPAVQQDIMSQSNPMLAKMKSKPHRGDARPDFTPLRVPIMWWCLRIKLACNPDSFGALLRLTGEAPIVEDSHRDSYWGATPVKDDVFSLHGANVLGRLLGLLRGQFSAVDPQDLLVVPPPAIEGFRLYGDVVETLVGPRPSTTHTAPRIRPASTGSTGTRKTVTKPPAGEDRTFRCSRCFLVLHRNRLAPSSTGELICRECAG